MFSEACVSNSDHGGKGYNVPSMVMVPGGGDKGEGIPLVLTSSGGHISGRYASYWNAFLFKFIIVSFMYLRSPLDRILSLLDWKHHQTKGQRLWLD